MTRWSLWFPLVLKDPAKSTEDKQTENPSPCNKKLSLPRKADNLNRQDRLGWEKGCVISVSQMGNRGTERLSDLHKVCVRARNGSQISWILCHYLNNKTIFSLSCHSLEREGPVLSYTKLHHCLQGNLIKCYTCSIHLVFWFLLVSLLISPLSFLHLSFYPPLPLFSVSLAKDTGVNYTRRKPLCVRNGISRPPSLCMYSQKHTSCTWARNFLD